MKPIKYTTLRTVTNAQHIELRKTVQTGIIKNTQDFQLIYNSLYSDKINWI